MQKANARVVIKLFLQKVSPSSLCHQRTLKIFAKIRLFQSQLEISFLKIVLV